MPGVTSWRVCSANCRSMSPPISCPTRYAGSHAEGLPFEHFGVLHSDEALRYAREIIEFARPYVAAA